MKITIVMGFFLPMPPVAGGATEKSWDALAREFARRGHAVTIISRSWPGWADDELREGVHYLRVRGDNHTSRLLRNLWLDFLWSWRVTRHLPAADVTVVNCVSLPVWLGWWRGHAGRLVVMTGRMPKGQYRLYRRLDRVLAVSSPVKAAVLAENSALAPVIRISGYPIQWHELARARPAPDPNAPVTIGYVGRLHREKGLDVLVAALRRLAEKSGLPRWRIVICGPQKIEQGGSGEEYADSLKRSLADAVPGDTVEFLAPAFSDEKLAEIYRRIDIFCYPSLALQGETFGVAVAEAMAAGAVPVVSALPCFEDFIRPADNGERFDQNAPDAAARLADAIAGLLLDPGRRNRLAAAARATAQQYDFPTYADRLLADFSTLK